MIKNLLVTVLAVCLLPLPVSAAELPQELLDELDGTTRSIVQQRDLRGVTDFMAGVLEVLQSIRPELGERVRGAVKSAALLLTAVLAASLATGVFSAAGEGITIPVSLTAVLVMAGIALQDMNGLVRSAQTVLTELESFTSALLPTLFAAVAATGAVTAAAAQQVVAAWLSAVLIRLVNTVLLPLLMGYLALVTAASALPSPPLASLAESLKKGVTWLLGAILSAFTAYLSLAHVLSGNADALTLRLTKATLSSVVPVVGEILSGTAETVLVGAGLLKNAVGIVGLIGVTSLSLLPFLTLLGQYLCYRVAAAAACAAGGGEVGVYLSRLGGAFGLLLGMVGACVLLVFIAVFAAVAVVTP